MKRIWFALPFCIWTILILTLSAQPYQKQSIQPYLHKQVKQEALAALLPDIKIKYRTSVIHAKQEPFRFVEFIFRKSAHMFVYATLAIFAFVALIPYRRGYVGRTAFVLFVVFSVASLDEWIQSLSPDRTGAVEDVMIDMVGAICALLLVYIGVYVRSRSRSRQSEGIKQ